MTKYQFNPLADFGAGGLDLTLEEVPGEPNGFANADDAGITFDDGTRTLEIAPAVSSYDFYSNGIKFTKSSATSVVITDVEGLHFVYFDDSGALQHTVTWNENLITVYAIVSMIYWDATNNTGIYVSDELHLLMQGYVHSWIHNFLRAQYKSGFALENFTVDDVGNSDTHAQFSSAAGVMVDEDRAHSADASANPGQFPILYKDGASGYWRKDAATNFACKSFSGGSGRLAWNENIAGTWQQTEADQGKCVLAHLFATNDYRGAHKVIVIQGQAEYATVITARAGAATEINSIVATGLPFVEFIPLATIIFQTSTAYSNTPKARIRSTDEGDDYVDFRQYQYSPTAGPSDHGSMAGLGDDDHLQYLLIDGSRTMTGKLTVDVDTGGVYDSTTVAAIFGDPDADAVDSVYISGNCINGSYNRNDGLGGMWINYRGYQNSATQFRDLVIYDGKGAVVASFAGSTKTAIFNGPVTVNNNLTAMGYIVAHVDTSGVYDGTTLAAYFGDALNASAADNVYIIGETINAGFLYNADGASLFVNYRGYNGGTTRFRNFNIADGKGNNVAVFAGSTKNLTLYGDFILDGGEIKFSTAAATAGIIQSGDDLFIKNTVHGGEIWMQAEDTGGTIRSLISFSADTGIAFYHLGTLAASTVVGGLTVISNIGIPGDTDLITLANQDVKITAQTFTIEADGGEQLRIRDEVSGHWEIRNMEDDRRVTFKVSKAGVAYSGFLVDGSQAGKATFYRSNVVSFQTTQSGLILGANSVSGKIWQGGASLVDLYIDNDVHGGRILIQAENTGGTNTPMAIFDPDGPALTITGKMDVESTTAQQFEVRYDGSNYAQLDVSSAGVVTLATTGSASHLYLEGYLSTNFKANAGAYAITFGSAAFKPFAVDDNTISLGSATARWSSLYVGTGDTDLDGNLLVNGGDIGITADTDLMALAADVLTINGQLIVEKDTGGAYDIDTVTAIFGDSTVGQYDSVFITGNTINAGWGGESDANNLFLNYRGYLGGTGKFRDLYIGDGKGTVVVFIDGSAKTMAITAAMSITGTLGFTAGTTVNEFSTDGTMAGNSDDAVPTEAAIVTYVAAEIATHASDIRLKENINDYYLGLDFIARQRPVGFNFKNKPEVLEHGLIAQEVKSVMDDLDVDFSGWYKRADDMQVLNYQKFVIPLINAVKELKPLIGVVAGLREEIDEMKRRLSGEKW